MIWAAKIMTEQVLYDFLDFDTSEDFLFTLGRERARYLPSTPLLIEGQAALIENESWAGNRP